MRRFRRFLAGVLVAASVFLRTLALAAEGAPAYPRAAAQESPDGGVMLADVLVARPLGIAACVLGLVGTALAAPFAAISGNMDEVAQRLVADPFAYTFERPVGHFPGELPGR